MDKKEFLRKIYQNKAAQDSLGERLESRNQCFEDRLKMTKDMENEIHSSKKKLSEENPTNYFEFCVLPIRAEKQKPIITNIKPKEINLGLFMKEINNERILIPEIKKQTFDEYMVNPNEIIQLLKNKTDLKQMTHNSAKQNYFMLAKLMKEEKRKAAKKTISNSKLKYFSRKLKDEESLQSSPELKQNSIQNFEKEENFLTPKNNGKPTRNPENININLPFNSQSLVDFFKNKEYFKENAYQLAMTARNTNFKDFKHQKICSSGNLRFLTEQIPTLENNSKEISYPFNKRRNSDAKLDEKIEKPPFHLLPLKYSSDAFTKKTGRYKTFQKTGLKMRMKSDMDGDSVENYNFYSLINLNKK